MEDVENDLRELNLKRWRQKAINKEEWRSVVKGAKVLRKSQSQEVRRATLSFSKRIQLRGVNCDKWELCNYKVDKLPTTMFVLLFFFAIWCSTMC
jgi:hypothetical protein